MVDFAIPRRAGAVGGRRPRARWLRTCRSAHLPPWALSRARVCSCEVKKLASGLERWSPRALLQVPRLRGTCLIRHDRHPPESVPNYARTACITRHAPAEHRCVTSYASSPGAPAEGPAPPALAGAVSGRVNQAGVSVRPACRQGSAGRGGAPAPARSPRADRVQTRPKVPPTRGRGRRFREISAVKFAGVRQRQSVASADVHSASIAASTSSLAARRAGQLAAASPSSAAGQEGDQAGDRDGDLVTPCCAREGQEAEHRSRGRCRPRRRTAR